ncbi:MAG TPA: NAD(P)/FAD-dependent oxidoreductase [Candidatus Polarisedimenticolaceae bacterium]|nr:NAD(P)/FAD-dependent oxidoreductase [Candidatus Polarisedimenticolaceae bacterium]
MTEETAVLILGGGPVGSAAGIVLASRGVPAILLESDRHPRFHVGESMLPHALPLFDRLGVHDTVRSLPRTIVKPGASFANHDGTRNVIFWFDEAFAPALPHAYNLSRDEFDGALFRIAGERGVDVREGWKAVAPEWDGDRLNGVRVRTPQGDERTIKARCVLDATGQGAFLATRMGWKSVYPDHKKLAIVGHYDGCFRPEGREAGNIVITITESGWFWFIPFRDGATSVGAVLDARRFGAIEGGLEAQFDAAVAATPDAARRLQHATRTIPAAAVQNFSFKVSRTHGDGFAMVGDAAGFLDPVFSTGVYIGMTVAERAAHDVATAITAKGRVDAADTAGAAALNKKLQRLFFSLIRSYYDPDFLAFFFHPRHGLQLPAAVVSVLAGDVLRDGAWKTIGRFRVLQGLGKAQRIARKFGRPIVPPLDGSPGDVRLQ